MSSTSSDSSGDESSTEVNDGLTLANSRLLKGVPDLAVTSRSRMKTEVRKVVKIQELGSKERSRTTVKRNRIQSPSSEEDCFPEPKHKLIVPGESMKTVKKKESSTARSSTASRPLRLEGGEKLSVMASLLSPAPLLGTRRRRQDFKESTDEKRRKMSSKTKNAGSVVDKRVVKNTTQENAKKNTTAFQSEPDLIKGSRQDDMNNRIVSSTSIIPLSVQPSPQSTLPPVASSQPHSLTPAQEGRLSSLLVQLIEKKIKESLSHSERELLRSACHVMQCQGCEDFRLHGKGCGQCRGRGKETRRRGEGKAKSRYKEDGKRVEKKRKADITEENDEKKAELAKTSAMDTVSEALVKVVREQVRSFKTATIQQKNVTIQKSEAPHNNNVEENENLDLYRGTNEKNILQNQKPSLSSPTVPPKVCILNDEVVDMSYPDAHVFSSSLITVAEDGAMTDSEQTTLTSSPSPPLLEDGMWDELDDNILCRQARHQAELDVDKVFEQLPSADLPSSQKKVLLAKEGVLEAPKSNVSTSFERPESSPEHQDLTLSPAPPKKVLVLKNGVWETSKDNGRYDRDSEQPALAPLQAPPKKEFELKHGEWVWQNKPKLVDVHEDVDGPKGGYFSIR